MMGGDRDASSKGIFGLATCKSERHFLLVVDPHYFGAALENRDKLHRDAWVHWKPVEDFMESSFYNLCLPQCKHS